MMNFILLNHQENPRLESVWEKKRERSLFFFFLRHCETANMISVMRKSGTWTRLSVRSDAFVNEWVKKSGWGVNEWWDGRVVNRRVGAFDIYSACTHRTELRHTKRATQSPTLCTAYEKDEQNDCLNSSNSIIRISVFTTLTKNNNRHKQSECTYMKNVNINKRGEHVGILYIEWKSIVLIIRSIWVNGCVR